MEGEEEGVMRALRKLRSFVRRFGGGGDGRRNGRSFPEKFRGKAVCGDRSAGKRIFTTQGEFSQVRCTRGGEERNTAESRFPSSIQIARPSRSLISPPYLVITLKYPKVRVVLCFIFK